MKAYNGESRGEELFESDEDIFLMGEANEFFFPQNLLILFSYEKYRSLSLTEHGFRVKHGMTEIVEGQEQTEAGMTDTGFLNS